MKIVLVLGKRLLPSGNTTYEYKELLCEAILLLRKNPTYFLVISGGVTVDGLPSEAAAGLALIPREFWKRVFVEERSKNAYENIAFTRRLIDKFGIEYLLVLTGTAHEPRIRLLFKRLWPEVVPVLHFDGVPTRSLKEQIFYPILFLFTILHLDERVLMPIMNRFRKK